MSTTEFIDGIKTSILSDLQTTIREEIDRLYLARITTATLSAEEAANYLGVSKECLYQMTREKQLPFIHMGSSRSKRPNLRFRLISLDSWMSERERASIAN